MWVGVGVWVCGCVKKHKEKTVYAMQQSDMCVCVCGGGGRERAGLKRGGGCEGACRRGDVRWECRHAYPKPLTGHAKAQRFPTSQSPWPATSRSLTRSSHPSSSLLPPPHFALDTTQSAFDGRLPSSIPSHPRSPLSPPVRPDPPSSLHPPYPLPTPSLLTLVDEHIWPRHVFEHGQQALAHTAAVSHVRPACVCFWRGTLCVCVYVGVCVWLGALRRPVTRAACTVLPGPVDPSPYPLLARAAGWRGPCCLLWRGPCCLLLRLRVIAIHHIL